MTMTMTKSEANNRANMQLRIWSKRNAEPGVLPCIPVVMINSLTGDQPGLVLNIAKGMTLADTAKVLRVAMEQVQKQIEVEAN